MNVCRTLLLSLVLLIAVGCGQQSSTTVANETHDGHTDAAKTGTGAKAAQGVALGNAVEVGHFRVVLTSDPSPPRMGDVAFTVQLDHHGEPVTNGKVHIQFSMPGMGMGGPGVEMTHAGNGRYQGRTKLPMGGEYQADVHIRALDDPLETARFKFEAAEG